MSIITMQPAAQSRQRLPGAADAAFGTSAACRALPGLSHVTLARDKWRPPAASRTRGLISPIPRQLTLCRPCALVFSFPLRWAAGRRAGRQGRAAGMELLGELAVSASGRPALLPNEVPACV